MGGVKMAAQPLFPPALATDHLAEGRVQILIVRAHEIARPGKQIVDRDLAVVHLADLRIHLVETARAKTHKRLLCEGGPAALRRLALFSGPFAHRPVLYKLQDRLAVELLVRPAKQQPIEHAIPPEHARVALMRSAPVDDAQLGRRRAPPLAQPLAQRRADEVFRAEALRRVPLLERLNLSHDDGPVGGATRPLRRALHPDMLGKRRGAVEPEADRRSAAHSEETAGCHGLDHAHLVL
mmetsp:Transcript_35570/g.113807  ORF Transcript_35570/g.113807 Transcript_35570/m.113807 type:complete len:238 (-) Transcript_35570:663-1376(-)